VLCSARSWRSAPFLLAARWGLAAEQRRSQGIRTWFVSWSEGRAKLLRRLTAHGAVALPTLPGGIVRRECHQTSFAHLTRWTSGRQRTAECLHIGGGRVSGVCYTCGAQSDAPVGRTNPSMMAANPVWRCCGRAPHSTRRRTLWRRRAPRG